jgi:hypothetical protein
MKTLTVQALAEIAKQHGTEPINILGIDWFDTGEYTLYADRELTSASAKIISLSEIETTLSNSVGQARSMTVTLDDTENDIKAIFNSSNIHNKKCILYQNFISLANSDKFVIFNGRINAPIVWDEGQRQVSFAMLSEIENKEVSVSLEETQIDYPSDQSTGDPWPLCFGNVLHVPATKLYQSPVAKLLEPFCIVDRTLQNKLDALSYAWQQQQLILRYWTAVFQGSDIVNVTGQELLVKYIYYMKLERSYTFMNVNLQADIIKGEGIKRLKRGKTDAEKVFINALAQNEMDLDATDLLLLQINGMRTFYDRMIRIVEWETNIQKVAANNVVKAYNGLITIYNQYYQIQNEICKQEGCADKTVRVSNSEDFEQDTPLDLVIRGMRWRGSFSDGTLYIHSDGLPRYTDVPLGARQSVKDDCGRVNELKGLDKFWVSSADYNLTNMYCLVRKRGETRGHMIKVIEQDGTKCTFELNKYGDLNNGGKFDAQIVTGDELPTLSANDLDLAPTGVGPSPNDRIQAWENLSTTTLALLGDTVPGEDELQDLIKIEWIINNNPTVTINGVVLSTPILWISPPNPRNIYTIIGEDVVEILEASVLPLDHWFEYGIPFEEYEGSVFWEAKVGDTVQMTGQSNSVFVANILPSTIKAVMAYRTIDDVKTLARVPTAYYTKNESEDLLDADDNIVLTVTSLNFPTPINEIAGEGWEGVIYVTLESSVGPNVVDVIKHLISTYTDKSYDTTSFNAVHAIQEAYPANFAILDRRDVLELINSIAQQARCVVYENNDIFYIKYLSQEPTSVKTLTESDVKVDSMNIDHDSTDKIITKLVALWREHYLPEDPNKIVLRHNINLYGLHEEEQDYFIYNNRDLVEKSATFWLIRNANVWKHLRFETFLKNIDLDNFDAITLDFGQDYVADSSVKGVIEEMVHDTENNIIQLSVWLPIKIGTMTPYVFAWPGSADSEDRFPTDLEISEGNAGGSGIGRLIVTPVTGTPDD